MEAVRAGKTALDTVNNRRVDPRKERGKRQGERGGRGREAGVAEDEERGKVENG